jgi:hypothetical protein
LSQTLCQDLPRRWIESRTASMSGTEISLGKTFSVI